MHIPDTSVSFAHSFGEGQLNSSGAFASSSCIIDLNPDPSKYEGLSDGKFPMKFSSATSFTDEYKKSRIALIRIPKISGKNSDQFEMGSHSSDYE